MDQIQTWVTSVFQDSSSQTAEVNNMIQLILSIFNADQIKTFATEFQQIDDISSQTVSVAQITQFMTAVKNIIGTVYPILEQVKTTILEPAELNLIKTNLDLFVQVLILVILYNIQNKVNVQAILPYLPALSEIASTGVNLEVAAQGFFAKYFKCCIPVATTSTATSRRSN